MLAKVYSCSLEGIDGVIVEVEVDLSYGLPGIYIVGLPEASVRESRDRVKTAIKNSGYDFPMERLVVNLAPADIKKEGTGLDLPMALAILIASGIVAQEKVEKAVILGELSLDGSVKKVKASLSYAIAAKEKNLNPIIVPKENAREASMIEGIDVLPVENLSQVVDFFTEAVNIKPQRHSSGGLLHKGKQDIRHDFSEVKGQYHVKKSLEIAAAGFHHVLMTGPPGSGKSMLAKRLSTIMPELTYEEIIEITRIYSAVGLTNDDVFDRPFRSPHHTISDAGLVGGGSRPLPGEISLAHNGVLFLDELPEFRRNVLEVLRQPIEDGQVTIARSQMKVTYPAKFMLVAAMNPCPCGFLSDPTAECHCTPHKIQRYRSKLSGPLLDRIDIQIEVPRIDYKTLSSRKKIESSSQIKDRVDEAFQIQMKRFEKSGILNNGGMASRHIKDFCRLNEKGNRMLERAVDQLGFSARACHAVLRVARTIADLETSDRILSDHIAQAVSLRSFDRSG